MRSLAICMLTALLPLTAIGADHDFDDAVASVEQTYHLHQQHVPMVGFASFCAHTATGGAVKGLRLAVFEDSPALPNDTDMAGLLKDALGTSWSMIVESRESGSAVQGEQALIYARPHGERITLLVASRGQEGLTVVRMDMNAAHFRKWMRDPVRYARHPETD